MKIVFYVPNGGLTNVDFRKPQDGNPGSGAAEYLHVALPYYLRSKGVNAIIYAQNTKTMPPDVPCEACGSLREAAKRAAVDEVDFFVFRPRIDEEDNILELIDELKLNSIGRAALTPSAKHQRKMANTRYFKALVAVGSEQFDYLCDSPISAKLTYIDNGISFAASQKALTQKNTDLVVYMGAMVHQKGFHVLAKAWPEVLKRKPNAKLRVIGSSRIYNENFDVGPLGIADVNYEKDYIIPNLCDQQGNLDQSVEFLGALGAEKYEHLSEALVSVPNPTGQTETCCVSAVEMQSCGSAVVSGAYYALLGTVENGNTGLLGRGEKQLVKNICYLLDNPDIAIRLGANGRARAAEKYDFPAVADVWKNLFKSIHSGGHWKPKHQFRYLRYHRKWLRLLNFIPSRVFGRLLFWPSVQELEAFLIKCSRTKRVR